VKKERGVTMVIWEEQVERGIKVNITFKSYSSTDFESFVIIRFLPLPHLVYLR
jgi:hypothetical protein